MLVNLGRGKKETSNSLISDLSLATVEDVPVLKF